MSIETEIYEKLSHWGSNKINELLEQAVCKHLGVEHVNLYEHINRMSKREVVAEDMTICYYDSTPIFRMKLIPNENGELGFTVKYKFE